MTTEITTADRCELLDDHNWDYNEETGLWSKYGFAALEVEEAYDIQIAFNTIELITDSHYYIQEMFNQS